MKDLRGVNAKLISAFKSSKLYKLVKENPREVLACIRNNAIGIYYNADRVAMASFDRKGKLKCTINNYYLNGRKNEKANRVYTPDEIYNSFNVIKNNSDKRSTLEKKAQQALVYSNNANPQSKWICLDIEYRQSTKVQVGIKEKDQFTGRFDIIAISETKPHRIAIIELKYNGGAIRGKSGVVKHLKDFYNFNNELCIDNLKKEIQTVLGNLTELGLSDNLPNILDPQKDFIEEVEFYMICLYDTKNSPRGTVGGYLFKEKRPEWGTKRVSKKNAENELPAGCDILNKVKFLFKRVHGPVNLDIDDILDISNYEN
ncbi:MAG: hypothetical protein K2I87_00425 [Bacteroidales bacterium]|nr:hypothetical protein [Bacteroidales bacterium]